MAKAKHTDELADIEDVVPEVEPKAEVKGVEKSSPVSRKGDDKIVLEHPLVKGNADGIGIYLDGKEETLSLKEGKLTLPRFDSKGNPDERSAKLRELLLSEKWIDHTDYGISVSNPPPPPSEPVIVSWRFKHPQANKNHPLNVKIGIHVRGQEVSIDVKDNEVETRDPAISEILIRDGFVLISTEQEKKK